MVVVKITTGEGSEAESPGPWRPAVAEQRDGAPGQERVDPILPEVNNGI